MKRLLLAALVALSLAQPGVAEDVAHEHGSLDSVELNLNDGERWPTDRSLRQGMLAIRDVINGNLYAVHTGRMTQEGYAGMAAAIEDQVQFMVRECKLPPAADAELHKLIGMLGQAVQEMTAGPDRKQGVIKVVKTLEAYGDYFDHPGWKPDQSHE